MSKPEAPKKSRTETFLEFIRGRDKDTKDDPFEEASLARLGYRVNVDRVLKDRKCEYLFFLELFKKPIMAQTLKERMEELLDQMHMVNSCVQRVGGVYAGAGSDADSAKLMRGWDKLFSNQVSKAKRIMEWWADEKKVTSENKHIHEIHVRNFEIGVLWHLLYPDAFDVLNYCFKEPQGTTVTVLQTMGQQYGAGIDINKATENM